MNVASALVGVAMLFSIDLVEGKEMRIDLDCPDSALNYNEATKVFTCGKLVLDVSGCAPSSVKNVDTGNATIVCTQTGKFTLTCPGGFRALPADSAGGVHYACDDARLPAPGRIRIITK